jgi:endonuclease III-like uncharacterized protein
MPHAAALQDHIAFALAAQANKELDQSLKKIAHCLAQLTDDQIWWRPNESQNSIANLILHLSGNLRQWIIAGVGGAKDTRDRSREFSRRDPIPKSTLLIQLQQTVAESSQVLLNLTPADLLRPRHIQYADLTPLAAMLHTIGHFQGHTQEIIHMTRRQLGDGYQFLVANTNKGHN